MGNYAREVVDLSTGTLVDGADTTVGSAVVEVVVATQKRRAVVIQNIGSEPCRVGSAGVSATSGLRLPAGASVTFRAPFVTQDAIYAVREGLADTTVTFLEVRA